MGARASLDGCGKYRPHRESIPGKVQPVRSRVKLRIINHNCDSTPYTYSSYKADQQRERKFWVAGQQQQQQQQALGKLPKPLLSLEALNTSVR